jgi:hypothetical protein
MPSVLLTDARQGVHSEAVDCLPCCLSEIEGQTSGGGILLTRSTCTPVPIATLRETDALREKGLYDIVRSSSFWSSNGGSPILEIGLLR